MDLTTLLVWLAKNRSIRHLSLGKNFNNIKSKWVESAANTHPHEIISDTVFMMQLYDTFRLSSLSKCPL